MKTSSFKHTWTLKCKSTNASSFAAANHNYDHKLRTLKHRNTQDGSISSTHKSQTMTFWTRVEASNVINDPKCNKGPKRNNFGP